MVPLRHVSCRISGGGMGLFRSLSSSSSLAIDLRSDTVTKPCQAMLRAMTLAPVGDDVMREDPTVQKLESMLASRFGKEAGLYLPTGTMSNLCAIQSHCHRRGSEIIVGALSHLCLYEAGNVSQNGGVHSRQVVEDPATAQLPIKSVLSCIRSDDVHYPLTSLACIENTHNVLGGVPLSKAYVDSLSKALTSRGVPLHVDGARIFNASVALGVSVSDLCAGAASVSVCLSKGLGAPLGSVLVGDRAFVERARRARKALGGGMRQAGVVAAAGVFAVENNVERLREDHERAAYLCDVLSAAGFKLPRRAETNLIFFGMPEGARMSIDDFAKKAKVSGVLIGSGYSGGTLCRAALHKNITDEDVDRAAKVLTDLLV